VKKGWIVKTPSLRHNLPDELITNGQYVIAAPAVAAFAKCSKCPRRDRPVNAVGLCYPCAAFEVARAWVKQYFEQHGPTTEGDMYSQLKMDGCKSRPFDLKRAYGEMIGNYVDDASQVVESVA
jgi:hypothetical protein